MNICIPEKAAYIIEKLEQEGHEAYVVGGCVRDALLRREPEDWDITTSASPFQVKKIFRRTIDTGIQHGTVTVMLEKEGFEVTTYRIDGIYEDGRHPASVEFTSKLEEDLKRRDFTINAMAYNPRTGLVDLFGGQKDLEQGAIRCVGNANERFTEDALRILRAVRFAAQLGFEIEDDTKFAITKLAPNLSKVSQERIQVELTKLLMSKHPEQIRTAYELGVTAVVLPELDAVMNLPQNNPYHCYTVGNHTIAMLEQIYPTKTLRWAALLHDFGKLETHKIDENGEDHFYGHAESSANYAKIVLRRLKFDNDTIDQVSRLVMYHAYHLRREKKIIRRCMNRIGVDLFEDLLEVMRADTMAKSSYQRQERLDDIIAIRNLYKEIIKDNECITLKQLAVNGQDLIRAGIRPGKQMGELLHAMLDYVLEYPEQNQKDILLEKFMTNTDGKKDE
ncbi:MAG: CCA tRNA nucleotidyltransferase [Clostridiales bacterium]|nr:CCA tRNA nucleotidyltransferase [Clostridiales bacterium]